ncbi:hypothetical protein M758_4G190100 [Ceratodon purpureus]|nr:hypothetical protein M758_4G190100 [Ceratodon purpureus]KAG0620111.1 hypothetical protein M758_4G190100 [Ceratodon purpureus]
MDVQQKRRGVASWLCAERRIYGKSTEIMCGYWYEKPFMLKLALMMFLGLTVLLLPQYLTFNSSLRQRLIGSSLLVVRDKTTEAVRSKPDETLGGLLLPPVVFENNTCMSRSQEYSLRLKTSRYKPSLDLIAKLREYERRHRRCAQEAKYFNPSNNATEEEFGECRFIVWIATAGLGNRVMTLASAFVYALLMDRVLLIDRSGNPDELFCEPFPSTSWLLPETFPNEWMRAIEPNSSFRLGFLIQNDALTSSHNGYAYLNMMHDYDGYDRKFFCADCQASLSRFPWLFLKSNQYFIPGLHFVPEFHEHLDKLFPERETVFHHIVRYLFHPSDSVWRLISSFYNTNLANAQHQVGLQIRYLAKPNITTTTISDLVLNCTLENKLLPNVTLSEGHVDDSPKNTTSISVLVASLHEVFYESLREIYQNRSSSDGRHLGVYTASHEEGQYLESIDHDKKALADIYLLSLSDTLVTSSWSTFGYVAQGISGVMPWLLPHLESGEELEEVLRNRNYCHHGVSLEPCFHMPPALDCDNKGWYDNPGKTLPYIQYCEDVWWGIKIMERAPSNRSL